MSDEIPEDYSSPFAGEEVVIRVGSFNYTFEHTQHDTLIYKSRYPVMPSDDDEDEPFDPANYR